MKTISIKKLEENEALYAEVGRVLNAGGLVCLPCGPAYRILADLTSEEAVKHLLQSKRRTSQAPCLIFVKDESMLDSVAAEVCPLARRLIGAFWPGPLTILFEAHPDLPLGVRKALVRAKGKLGVRIPDKPIVQRVVQEFDRPLLVSSANPQSKKGASSPAQVRKNFLGRVDLFIDAGDLPPAPASTVIDVVEGNFLVTRPGAIPAAEVERAARA